VEGVGESLHDPRGNTIVYYAWGLGKVSNNLVEAYSLWREISIEKYEEKKKMIAFGDSFLVIKIRISLASPGIIKLKLVVSQIKKILFHFEQICFYHTKREVNEEADHWENLVTTLDRGVLDKNGIVSYSLVHDQFGSGYLLAPKPICKAH